MTFRARTGAYVCIALASAIASWPALRDLVQFSMANESASHALLVPLVSALLIVHGRRGIFSAISWAPVGGGMTITAGAVLMAAAAMRWDSTSDSTLRLALLGLVVANIGAFLLVYGSRAARSAAFALGFLLFLIPLPGPVLAKATEVLKIGSAEVTSALFALSGVAYHREGFVFSLPSFTIQVADECSGIRSSLALLFTALVVGHLSLRRVWARTLLVLVVLPVTVLKNAVRIVSLSLLATHVHPSFLVGRLHSDGGVIFFVLALALLAPALVLLRRSEAPRGVGTSGAALST